MTETAFDKIVESLRSQGMNPEEILKELSSLFRELEALRNNSTSSSTTKDEEKLKDLLKKAGIPCNLPAYLYLLKAIPMYKQNPRIKIYHELYVNIANLFNTSRSKVERAIRQAIEKSIKLCPVDEYEQLWGNTIDPNKGKPINSEFIAALANML